MAHRKFGKTRRFRKYRVSAKKYGRSSSQVQRNKTAIRRLAKATLAHRQYQVVTTHEVGQEIYCKQIMVPSDFVRIFQTENEPDDQIPRVYSITSVICRYVFQCGNNSMGNMWLQYVIFSLKPNVRAQWIDRTNDGTTLTKDEDYSNIAADSVDGVTDGFCAFQLNPAYFSIHHDTGMKRIGTVSMEGNDLTNIRDSTFYGQKRLNWKKTFKAGQHRDKGFESLVAIDVNHSTRLYSVLFCNAGATSPIFQTVSWNINGKCIRS